MTSSDCASRGTVLVLVDELKSTGLPRRTRTLIRALGSEIEPVVIAQTYLSAKHRARRLPFRHALYGFGPDEYQARVRGFAEDIAARHAPDWVLAYGWENSHLILELDRLDIPVLVFVDYSSRNPGAENHMMRVFSCADEIIFADEHIPASLTISRWSLQARPFKIMPRPAKTMSGIDIWRRLVPGYIADKPRTRDLVEAGARISIQRRRDRAQATRDEALIRDSAKFNAELFAPSFCEDNRDATISGYLRQSRHAIPRNRLAAGRFLRRPLEGFNPLVYASDQASFDEAAGEDPLAHYLRQDMPHGRWSHRIIGPSQDAGLPKMRTAVHVHVHYVDLLPDLIDRLCSNHVAHDLFVTTTSDDRRSEIEKILGGSRTQVVSLTTRPNRGRDIWPFLDLLGSGALTAYDVVGHLHGKRSPNYALAGPWRDFLWRHLIGRPERMLDAVVSAFAANPKLGLVMPEDPHLEGWEANLPIATALARRIGIDLPLPAHFDFPVGAMFWARPAALAPLADLGLTIEDMPIEPIPDDGTILHAIERLVPFIVTKAGYSLAATHVPGSLR